MNSEPQSPASHLLDVHTRHAADYRIFLDAARRQPLELRRQPVYVWTNPVRNGGQDGAVFLWTARGRPHAVGCIFSYVENGVRKVHHEFHTLSPEVLRVEHSWPGQWVPRAGLTLESVPDAPAPADNRPAARSSYGHSLAASAPGVSSPGPTSVGSCGCSPSRSIATRTPTAASSTALAFVTTAGTDPEIFLLLEARETAARATWHYAGIQPRKFEF